MNRKELSPPQRKRFRVEASHTSDGPYLPDGEFVRKCDAMRVANRLRRLGMYVRIRYAMAPTGN